MNRLVIIGNGFDLAHGLPTGYCDFIDDLWIKILISPEQFEDLVTIDVILYNYLREVEIIGHSNFMLLMEGFNNKCVNKFDQCGWDNNGYYIVEYGSNRKRYMFRYTNYVLKIICEAKGLNNWVNVENEYYKLLKECLKEEIMRQ